MKVAVFLYHPIHEVGGQLFLKPHHGRFLDGLADRVERIELCAPFFSEDKISEDLKKRGLVYDYLPKSSRLRLVRGYASRWSYPLRFLQQLRTALRADVVFFFTPSIGSVILGPILRLIGRPYICYVAVDLEPHFRDRFGSLGALVAQIESWVIAGSRGVLATGSRNTKRWASQTRTEWVKPLLNFDVTKISKEMPLDLSRTEDSFRLMYAGVISPRKKIEVMIEVVHSLKRKGKTASLKIFGAPSPEFLVYCEALQKQVQSLALSDSVHFEGYVSDPERLASGYRDADFFILPSRYEGFPKAVFEALLLGAIPVLSKIDSYEGFLQSGRNVIYGEEPQEIVEKLLSLDSVQRAQIREDNRSLARSFLDQTAVDQALALLKRAVGERQPQRGRS